MSETCTSAATVNVAKSKRRDASFNESQKMLGGISDAELILAVRKGFKHFIDKNPIVRGKLWRTVNNNDWIYT